MSAATNHSTTDGDPRFDALMAEVLAHSERFGHRQHIHVTWLAVKRHGTAEAIGIVSDGIQATARYAGAPQKYNATVSRAWVELVAHALTGTPGDDFDAFVEAAPALLDKRLLMTFYRPSTLATPAARTRWVEPDLAPFPWHHDTDPRATQPSGESRVKTGGGRTVTPE